MNIFLLLFTILFSNQLLAQSNYSERKIYQYTLENLRTNFDKKNPAQANLELAALRLQNIHNAYEYADEKWYRFYPNEDDRYYIFKQTQANYLHTKCTQDPQSKSCDELKTYLNTSPQYEVYKKNLQIVTIPKVNAADGTFTTADGKVFDVKAGSYISKQNPNNKNTSLNPIASEPTKENEPSSLSAQKNKKIEPSQEEDASYNCQWSTSLPRKIIRGPGCSLSGSRICTGYVTCGTNKVKADRLATCSESLCSEEDALACAKQGGFGSKNADAEDSTFTNYKKANTKSAVQ